MTLAFLYLCGFGVFGKLCSIAAVWDEDRQMPAEDVSAASERA